MKKLLLALLMTGVFVSMDVFAAPKRKCPAGTYSHAGASSCTSCLGNTISAEGASTCKACPSGQTANEQHTACVQVSTDAFSQISGAALYQKCPSKGNSYFYNGKCHQCPKNHQWDEKNEKCVNSSGASASKCPAHATCPKGKEDFLCNFGYYRKSKDAKTCTKCPQTADKCIGDVILCKPGYYLTDKRTCVKCSAGYECIGNAMPPMPCGAGEYAPAGSRRCLACPDNAYTPEEKATKCTPCPKNAKCYLKKFICNEGYYKTSDKAKTCTKCPAGYMCHGGVSRFKCPAGTYASAGSFVCTPCSGDTYSSAGASKCKSCPKGKKPNEKHTACVKA